MFLSWAGAKPATIGERDHKVASTVRPSILRVNRANASGITMFAESELNPMSLKFFVTTICWNFKLDGTSGKCIQSLISETSMRDLITVLRDCRFDVGQHFAALNLT